MSGYGRTNQFGSPTSPRHVVGLPAAERCAASNTPDGIPRWNDDATAPAGYALARKPNQWLRVAWGVKGAFPITEVGHPLTFEIVNRRKSVAAAEYAYPACAATAGPAINRYGTVTDGTAGIRLMMGPLIAFRRRRYVLAGYQRKPTVKLTLIYDDAWFSPREPATFRFGTPAA
jgi:hypothetical protein